MSLSHHGQVCLTRPRFERYLSLHRNVASLNILVHEVIILYFLSENIAVCPVSKRFIFLMMQKVFVHAFDAYVSIKVSFVWCIIAFVLANWWFIRIYVKINCFGVTVMRRRVFAHAIFNKCYCVSVTLTLSTYKFSYYSIRFQSQCTQKQWLACTCSFSISRCKEIFSRKWSTRLIPFKFPSFYISLINMCW